ncbi:MAG: T9SS type A sorting domain-containing protein [Saprospiraceae bacterium]|nr:T9SS type A sorting domain-containing protein [Saprospiraceae bacterium]
MKVFTYLPIAFCLCVGLSNPTQTFAQDCADNVVLSCSNAACTHFTGNGYSSYLFFHEDGTPGTTFKTGETIYHYAQTTTKICVSPSSTVAYVTANLPVEAVINCGPTLISKYILCTNSSSSPSNRLCQKVGPTQYHQLKATKFHFTTAGTHTITFANGDGTTVDLTIDDNHTAGTPYVTASSDVGTTITAGTSVTFSYTTNVTATSHTWKVNGVTQSTGTTYTTTTLANNDLVTCSVAFSCGGDLALSPMSSNTVTMTVNAVMPVELTAFTGKATQAGNFLEWTTASEVNNKGFALERQNATTKAWEDLMLFTGTNKPSTYQYLDETPQYLSYYRLRQIDNTGQSTHSKTIAVERKGDLKNVGLWVYPNPATDVLTIETGIEGNYQILNVLGQVVKQGVLSTTIEVATLPQGTYWLKAGAERVKFMKQ